MTHTLHRHGTPENLENDYIIFAISCQTVNAKGSAPKFGEFFKIVNEYNPAFCGDMKTGNVISAGLEKIAAGHKDNSVVHAVFTDKETVAKVLARLKEADLGISIVISGILDHVDKCCNDAGIKRHTIEHSLGIDGNPNMIPEDNILEISTMCGHGMVAFNLIKHMVDLIKKGKKTSKEAADELAAQCHCGIVNPIRAAALLELMAKN